MKKVLKISVLLVIAAALFAGCKKDADPEEDPNLKVDNGNLSSEEDPKFEVDDGILFPQDDVSENIQFKNIVFSDGDWIYTYKVNNEDESSQEAILNRYEWSISGNGTIATVTKLTQCRYGYGIVSDKTLPRIEKLKADGYSVSIKDDKYTYIFTKVSDGSGSSVSNSSLFPPAFKYFDFKKSDDNKKYYGFYELDMGTVYTVYIMKKN